MEIKFLKEKIKFEKELSSLDRFVIEFTSIEVKFPKVELDGWTLKNKKKVILNNQSMFISPLELQAI